MRMEELDRLAGLVRDLPQDKQQVLRMVHESGMGIAEVAEALGIPEGTVKSRLHYAARMIQRRWNDSE